MKFNINHKVKVRLTDFGRQHLRRLHDELFKDHSDQFPYQPKEEVDGWAEFQMHELFEYFGSCFVGPGSRLPFSTEIEIPSDDGVDVGLTQMKALTILSAQDFDTRNVSIELNVSEETVEKWRSHGTLVAEISRRLGLSGKGKLVPSDYKQEVRS